MLPKTVERAVRRGGISVVPQVPGAKVPLIPWKRYQDAPPSLDKVRRWAEKYPKCVWAMVCGPVSGYIVLDFDDSDVLDRYDLEPLVHTPHGGAHVWVKHPGYAIVGGSRVSPAFPGLDLRTEGHLATFAGPGYQTAGRKVYAVTGLPTPLQELLAARRRGAQAGYTGDVALPPEFTDYVPGSELLDEALDKVANGAGRNDVGFYLACQLRDERYDFETALVTMKKFAKRVPATANGQPYTAQESYNSLVQSYSQPARLPRALDPKKGERFNSILRDTIFRDRANQVLRSMKLGTFELTGYAGEQEEVDVQWTIDELQPADSNVLVTGVRKVGKTTFGLNLAKSLLDGTMFLSRFQTGELEGTVGYLNYEMSLRQFNQWVRRIGIRNHMRFVHWPLRGKHVDIMDDEVFAILAGQLRDARVEYLILDPWWRAIAGVADENSNSEVGAFLGRLDALKQASGIRNLAVITHTGKKDMDSARGASGLEGWADVLWNLTRTGDNRWFSAEGRDVGVEAASLMYDSEIGTFTWAGSKKEAVAEDAIAQVVQAVREEPGLTTNQLRDRLTFNANLQPAAIREARDRGWIRAEQDPAHAQRLRHYVEEGA